MTSRKTGFVAMLVASSVVAFGDDKKGSVVTFDGLSSTTPGDWKEVEPKPSPGRQFRIKEFKLPKAGADKADAELVISFFGEGSGGSARDNVKRWKGMFKPPAGKSIDDVAKVDEMDVGKVKVTYFDVAGTYLDRPFPMSPRAEERPDYRMITVIFASPKGPYFMRLVGPEKTIAHHKKGFDEWLKNFK